MQITDIKIRKLFDEGPMKAIVSVTFDGQLAVHDVKVINARDKFFIVMPSRKNPDETYRDIVHPINASFREMLEREVIAAYNAELEAAAAAVCAMGLAGEIGWSRMQDGDGNATYRNRIIDAIYNMDGQILDKGARYEIR